MTREIIDKIQKHDYELSLEDLEPMINQDLQDLEGCHSIINMLLGIIDQMEESAS